MPVKRVLGFAAVLLIGVCAGIIESSNGNASVTPAPRRKRPPGYVLLGDEHDYATLLFYPSNVDALT